MFLIAPASAIPYSVLSKKEGTQDSRVRKAPSNLLANIKKDVINRNRKIIDRISIMFWRKEDGDHNGV
jgi:hypothetical protein